MKKFTLGGFYNQNGTRFQLPLKINPSIDDLYYYLNLFKLNNGVLVLRTNKEENNSPYEMTLYSDDQHYLIMLETLLPDGDLEIRTFSNPSETKEFIFILGEPHSVTTITQDYSLVIAAFSEFFETGDVSKDLLS